MSDIISKEELNSGSDDSTLSTCLKQAINYCLQEGKKNNLKEVRIESVDENIMKELYQKRNIVLSELKACGFVVSTSSLPDDINLRNGWRVNERPIEVVPDKIKPPKGSAVDWRGDVTYLNFRMWVYI